VTEELGSGGKLAAEVLRRHDVDTVFTLSGGHLFPFYDGCVQTGVTLVDVRHEQTATFAAEGWAKVTRRVGVCALTAGPGVTNGVSALTAAQLSGSPVLAIGGRAPAERWGSGSLQELDPVPILAPVVKHAATAATTEAIPATLDAALRAARTPHRGSTFVDVALDVFVNGAIAEVPDGPAAAELAGADPDPESIATIARLVADAAHPVVVAGGDVYWDHAEVPLRAWAEAARVPVFANGMGRGTVPADHALAFARARSVALKEADLVLVAGTPLDFRLGFGIFGDARVIHLCDAPDRVATHAPLVASSAGDLARTFTALADGVAGGDHQSWIERLRDEERARRTADTATMGAASTPIKPQQIYGALRPRLDRDAIVIGDGGDFVSYAGQLIDSYEPGCFLDPGPFGCLGMGPGYALAAGVAHPGRELVLLLGDGAIGFSLGDLDTLVRFGTDVVMIVGNNGIWGLEKHPMEFFFGYAVAAELRPGTRYDLVLEALGGHGELVEDQADLGPALDRAFATKGPSLVNVLTDPADAYPRSSNLG
jgi:thiamine pyrophosphate-dependent acetolactate synthase large subunit-like protein